jgi:Tfp pilus assembly protein PilX
MTEVKKPAGFARPSIPKLPLLAALLLVGFFGLSIFQKTTTNAANAGDVIINELMYKPASNTVDDEYLELHNKTASPIDLENWCFTAGITLATANPTLPTCFEAGTTIPANGYLVISANPTQTNTAYGITAAASYAGSDLSNGGETLTLVDDSANVINSITYDDAAPWPTSPDGDGPSLELKDPNLDNTDGNNWGGQHRSSNSRS